MEDEKPTQVVHFGIQRGEPVTYGNWTVTPVARSLGMVLPGSHVGLIWNRPVALEVRSATGEVRTLPIQDVTRRMQLAFLVFGALGACILWLAFRLRRGSNE